jgi:hypothetical protein
MNEEAEQGSWYGNSRDWSQIIAQGAKGATSGMQGNAQNVNSRREAKEAKRRTLANMLNKSLRRNQDLFKAQQNYGGEMTDLKSQAMQQLAKGYAEALQGTSGY